MIAGIGLMTIVVNTLMTPILNLDEMDTHIGHLVDAGNGGRGSSPWLTIRESDGTITKFVVNDKKISALKDLANKPVTIWSQKARTVFFFTENYAYQVKYGSDLVINYEQEIRPGLEGTKAHNGFYFFFATLASLFISISLWLFNSARTNGNKQSK